MCIGPDHGETAMLKSVDVPIVNIDDCKKEYEKVKMNAVCRKAFLFFLFNHFFFMRKPFLIM